MWKRSPWDFQQIYLKTLFDQIIVIFDIFSYNIVIIHYVSFGIKILR